MPPKGFTPLSELQSPPEGFTPVGELGPQKQEGPVTGESRTFIDRTGEPKAKSPSDLQTAGEYVASGIKGVAERITAPFGWGGRTPRDLAAEARIPIDRMAGNVSGPLHPIEDLKATVSSFFEKPLTSTVTMVGESLKDPLTFMVGGGFLGKAKIAGGATAANGDEFLARLKATQEGINAPKPSETPPPKKPTPSQMAQDLKSFDRQLGAEQEAYRLVQKAGYGDLLKGKGDIPPTQIEVIRKKNPAVGKALDEIMARKNRAIAASKDTYQGEVLPPEGPRPPEGPPKLPHQPIAETGFRSKEDGRVVRTGPKHDKGFTDDPKWEPGFITKEGGFVNRQEAAKMVPSEHLKEIPGPSGLHSTDFGDKGVPERRADALTRRRLDQLPPKIRYKEIGKMRKRAAKAVLQAKTDVLTGLPNRTAYMEAERLPHQVSIDVDGLGWTNDNMGHPAGDALLREVAGALKNPAIKVYRTGGDEFIAEGHDPVAIKAAMDKANEILAEKSVKGTTPEGGHIEKKGLGLTYGIAETGKVPEGAEPHTIYGHWMEEADRNMNANKKAREAAGLRAVKGTRPKGITEHPPKGIPQQVNIPFEEGKIDPQLLATIAGTGIGALLGMGYLGDPRDQDYSSLIGKALEGGFAGFLLAQSPSFFMRARYVPKIEFIRNVTDKYGKEFHGAAEKMWEERVPEKIRESKLAKTLDERADVADIQYQANAVQGAGKAAHVETVQTIQRMREEGYTPQRLEPLWRVEEGKPVPPGLKKVYEGYYKPARKALDDNLREIASVTKRPLRTIEDEFMPRIALERKGPLQRLLEGHTEFASTGKPSSLQKRSVYSVHLQDGSDLVVHLGEKGKVTGFHNGEILDLGFTHDGRAPKLDSDVKLKSGETLGSLRQATRNQIESHTKDLRYWKDPVATVMLKRAETSAYLDQMKFFDELKNRPDFKTNIAEAADEAPPEWRPLNSEATLKLPQFRGMHFNPRYAEMLEDLTRRQGKIPGITAFNNLTTKALLLNPIPHIDNEITHWVMASGLSSFANPAKIGKLLPALRSVIKQDDLQMAINKAGGNMLYTNRWLNNNIASLGKAEIKLLGKDPEFRNMAKALGLAVPEAAQYLSARTGDFMWMVRDSLVTQLVQERMKGGVPLETAVQQVMKEMPAYRLPPRIAEDFVGETLGRLVSRAGQLPAITSFFRYHYAVYSEFGNIAKGLVRKDNRLHALDSVAALMAMWLGYEYIVDPIADEIAKSAGMAQGKARRPGPLHAIEKIGNIAQGKPDAGLYLILSIFSPPMWSPAAEAITGKTVTGRDVSNPNAPAYTQLGQRAEYLAQHATPSVGGGLFNAPQGTVPRTAAQALLQQLDIESKTQQALDRVEKAKRSRRKKEEHERRKRLGGGE